MPDTANEVKQAADILRRGGLIAFPTETVYGLGADARNTAAVRKIFAAKGRPPTNPLIVHVTDSTMAKRFAAVWPDAAERLAAALWPGPIALVLPKSEQITTEATAGRPTVALRAPAHPLAQLLLKEFDGPLAAPSANRSTHVSPTTARHVRDELGNLAEMILDGGPCEVGIESTVLDLTTNPPTLLRPGNITLQRIESLVGPITEFVGSVDPTKAAPSPGMYERHYAPTTPAYRFGPQEVERVVRLCSRPTTTSAILAIAQTPALQQLRESLSRNKLIEMPANPDDYARRLYAALHDADALRVQTLFIQEPPHNPSWHAVRDRIRRATQSIDRAE